MVGMDVVVVECDAHGNVDVATCGQGREALANLAALMVTYPSTHGVFEERSARSARSSTPTAARSTSTAPT
jgi:glycine dehydrogenase